MDTKDLIGLFSRQEGIVKPEELPNHVVVVGAGGIGSWTVLALAKMGQQQITVIDYDNIEDVNIAPQFYRVSDIGKNKAEVLAERVNEEMGKNVVRFINTKWEEWTAREEYLLDSLVDVLIMAVDSMDVRTMIWKDIKNEGLGLVIDGRMVKEMMEIFAIKPTDQEHVKFYEENLFPSSDVEETPCTERAVAYNQFVIAGIIGAQLKHYAKGELETKRILFDLFSFICVTS